MRKCDIIKFINKHLQGIVYVPTNFRDTLIIESFKDIDNITPLQEQRLLELIQLLSKYCEKETYFGYIFKNFTVYVY